MEIHPAIGFTICGIAIYLVWQFYKRKIQQINSMGVIPDIIPVSGFEVPVLANFTGLKSLPKQRAVSHNNAFPTLRLFENRIECSVLRKRSILLSEIEKVDISDTIGTRNLHIYVKGREDLFTSNLFKRRNLARVLKYLMDRGAPLTPGAKTFMSANAW